MRDDDDGLIDRTAWAAACGDVLSQMMAECGTTGYWVSQETRLPYSVVNRYQRGERAPSLFAAHKMCAVLDSKLDQYLRRVLFVYEKMKGV
jgi:hypothetical protein